MGLLDNKVCVITGGAGSVGSATARRFVAEGAKLMLVDLREDDLDRVARELNSPNVTTITADVSVASQVEAFLDAICTKWGNIDVIFSNAGDPGHIAPLTEYPEDAFDRTMAIHVKGSFLVCKYGLPKMNDGGSLIITSSVAGVRGGAGINMAYAAAKHAQTGVMRTAARFAAVRGIRVNTVNPGPIDNAFQTGIENRMSTLTGIDMTEQFNQSVPLKRHARPDEIAASVLYLASNLSTYVTGTVHMVDGGIMG